MQFCEPCDSDVLVDPPTLPRLVHRVGNWTGGTYDFDLSGARFHEPTVGEIYHIIDQGELPR